MKNTIEIRNISTTFNTNGRTVSGYAIRFNEQSVNIGFIETISSTALSREQIDDSDIFAFFNHDSNQVLARNGRADTLKLDLREDGLYYEFEAPDTPAGNELIEHIKRGEMYGTSFGFTVPIDGSGETWTLGDDDMIYREITHIEQLFEISPVFSPAYPTTTISARSLEKINELNNMKQDEFELRDCVDEEKKSTEDEEQEMKSTDDEIKEEDENRADEDNKDEDDEQQDEEQSEDTSSEEQEDEQQDSEEDEDDEENRSMKKTNKINTRNSKTMEKKFSLLKAIREAANGQKFDDATQAVVNAGAKAMRDAGQSYSGQIQLPVAEMREDPQPVHYTVDADGEHVVVTDYLNILEPLKAKNVLVNAGATYLTGLQGNLQIPSMTAENVYWEGEIDETENGAGSFSHVTMAPRRLSAFIDISKQFLVQDTLGAENLIRKLLVEAINDKLEETILSDDASSGAKPAGLFYNVSPTEIADYSDLCDFESDLEDANFTGEMKYVLSPKAKAALRSMIKGTNATGMIMENNAVDGTAVEVTTNIESGNLAYGDWSNLYIGQWGGIDLTVDNFTQATKGCVRLVINAFFDYKVVRDGAIVYGEIKTGA